MRGESANSSSSAARERVRAGDVLDPVDEHERMVPDDFEPTGSADGRERVAHDVGLERAVEEAFDGRQRDRRVVGLVCSVQREEHVVVGGARREQIDDTATDREPVAPHAEVDVAQHDALGAAVEEVRHEDGVGLTQHQRGARLHDARLLRSRCPRASGRCTPRDRCSRS